MSAANPFSAPTADEVTRLEPGLLAAEGFRLVLYQLPLSMVGRLVAGEPGRLVGLALGGAIWGYGSQQRRPARSVLPVGLALVTILAWVSVAYPVYLAEFGWYPEYYAGLAVTLGLRGASTLFGAVAGAWWARSARARAPEIRVKPTRAPDADRVRIPTMDPYEQLMGGGGSMSGPPLDDPYDVPEDDPRHLTVRAEPPREPSREPDP